MIGTRLKPEYILVNFSCVEQVLKTALLKYARKESIVPCSKMSTEKNRDSRSSTTRKRITITKHHRSSAVDSLKEVMYSSGNSLTDTSRRSTASHPFSYSPSLPPPAESPPPLPPLPVSPPPPLPPLPVSPPPVSPHSVFPHAPQPLIPLSSPKSPNSVSPPPASDLPKPDASLLGHKTSSVEKQLHLEVKNKIYSHGSSEVSKNCSAKTNNDAPEYFIDTMPSKIYISEFSKRSRQTVLENKYSCPSPVNNTANQNSMKPPKYLVSNSSAGCMRTQYSWLKEPTSPEIITLSDDDDGIECIGEMKKDSRSHVSKKKRDDRLYVPRFEKIVSTIPLPPSSKRIKLPEDVSSHSRSAELVTPTNLAEFVLDSQPGTSSSCITSNSSRLTSVGSFSDGQSNSLSSNRKPKDSLLQKSDTISSSETHFGDQKAINFHSMTLKDGVQNSSNSCFKIQTKGAFQSNVIQGLDEADPEYWPLERVRLDDITNHTLDFSDEVLSTRRKLENLRQWRSTGFSNNYQRNSGHGDAIFTLMSYNVLAQQLLTSNMYLYADCDAEHLDWQYRWTLLQHEIKQINADILTFQEVQSNHYHEYFLPWFIHLGFQGIYKKRTGDKLDGCAIFFRSSKFEFVESTSVEFCQPNTFLDRDNVGLICSLVCKHNNAQICVATTHLLYNPKRHDIKLAQLQLFLAEIERIAYSGRPYSKDSSPYIPLIITGDMNAYPYQSVINFLKQSSIRYYGLDSKSLTPLNTGRILSGFLLPRELGVTETCQHAGVLALRQTQVRSQKPSLQDQRARELSLVGIHHSERQSMRFGVPEWIHEPFTGYLQHPFHLKSVFKHSLDRLGGAPEVTAQVNDWQTVDYILYSQVYSNQHQRTVEGRLKLMARYDLLSGPEARQFGPLPSAVSPSDHFPLAAKFLLRGTAD